METDILSDQQWAITKGLLDERRTKFIETPDYGISHAIVFSNEREIFRKNGVTYLPIYYSMFLHNEHREEPVILPELEVI